MTSTLRYIRAFMGLLYLPLSLFFTYRFLYEIHASELLNFMFWFILVPFAVVFGAMDSILKAIDKEEYK